MSINTNLHLLVVEDHDKMRELLIQALRKLQFNNVYEAEDGEQAWEILSKKKIHIVFSDIVMPRMDGFRLLQKIRTSKDPHVRKLPVVMLTSQGEKESILRAAQYNIKGYIVKPFEAKVLLRKIKEISDEGLVDDLFD